MRRIVRASFTPIRCIPCWSIASFSNIRPLLQGNTFFPSTTETSNTISNNSNWEKTENISRHPRGINSSNKNNNNNHHHSGPVKDRFPPIATDLSDPRRRLALLVDASSVDSRVFFNTILPAAKKVGVPVLVRIFAVQISSSWESFVAGNEVSKKMENNNMDDSSNNMIKNEESNDIFDNDINSLKNDDKLRCPPVEFFRVERFIPVSMQMEADANHIFDFRRQNKIEAICFVCNEVDRGLYEGFLPNIAGNGFNQYIIDELGMAKEVLEDGRSADGTP